MGYSYLAPIREWVIMRLNRSTRFLLRKLFRSFLYSLYLLVLLELGMRIWGVILLFWHNYDFQDHGNKTVILAIGESTTFGLGVSPKDAYPSRLEAILNERCSGRKFAVLNLGVPGQTSTSILRLMLPPYIGHR